MSDATRVMPSFEAASFGFHHTVDSALSVLSQLGVSPSRVTVTMAGLGYPARQVISQSPAPGAPLDDGTPVRLDVAGLGFFHGLPVGMWDRGGEETPGTQEILELLDDPLQKAGHFIREGAQLFDVGPDNPSACRRWLSLFGVDADEWPPETWYSLSLLVPGLRELVDTERGIRIMFKLLLDLPLQEIRYFPSSRLMRDDELTLLAKRGSRLGVDCIVGDRLEDLAGVHLRIGPISLETYYAYRTEPRRRLFARVIDLCVSRDRVCRSSWIVGDPTRAPRLGDDVENARLGINSYLGSAPAGGTRTDA